ncbi:Rrf2 family transcriptional regulator [archaeon]|nr:Rrf2 family transcriptional regulator [archaeon]
MKEKNDLKLQRLAKSLEGLHMVGTICKKLNISKRTAVNYTSKLRKAGYLKTTRGYGGVRMYKISPVKTKEVGSMGLYETINRYSKVKLVTHEKYRIHGHKLSIEEALVKAIQEGEYRTVLAALGLFQHIKNWKELNKLAKKTMMGRKIGALYDTAKIVMRVKKMDLRTRRSLLDSKVKNRYIVYPIKSKNLKDIQEKWRVYVPFNKADLMRYKT